LLVAACSSGARQPWPSYGPGAGQPTAPSPAPADPRSVEFRFGVGDEIAMSVWKEPELTTSQRIMADGTISPPLLRTTKVVGKTVDEVQATLQRAYLEYLKDPKVSVKVVAIHSDRAFVLGEVRTPQAVSLIGPTTAIQAIAMAGGFVEEFASKSSIRIIRKSASGTAEVIPVDAESMIKRGQGDVALQRGDIVYVSATGVAEWSRTVGQALAPLSSAISTAGGVAALVIATKD
jgi:polysaccharide export outer membrane protein